MTLEEIKAARIKLVKDYIYSPRHGSLEARAEFSQKFDELVEMMKQVKESDAAAEKTDTEPTDA